MAADTPNRKAIRPQLLLRDKSGTTDVGAAYLLNGTTVGIPAITVPMT